MRLRLIPPVVATVAAVLLIGGCASTRGLKPQGEMVDADSIQAGHSLSEVAISDSVWPDKDWWKALGDPQLNDLIQEALADNPDLAMARARARKAQAKAGKARAERLPSINAGASLSGSHKPGTLLPESIGGGHFSWLKYGYAKFDWDLDLWGGKRAAWEAAVGNVHAADVDRQAARLAISTDVARAYARLGYATRKHSIAEDELERSQDAHDLTKKRVQAGIDSQLQLQRANAEVASAEQKLTAAGHEVDAARIALSTLLGKGPDRGLEIDAPEPMQPAALDVPSNLPSKLVGRRPDLVAARWRVLAAGKGIKAARARFLPDLSLGAMVGAIAEGSTNLFQLPARFYQIAPALSLPVFNGGKLRANLARRDANYDIAVAKYNKTLIKAVNQVASEVQQLDSLKAQTQSQRAALKSARKAWQLSEQRYKAGVGSFLESLDVRQQLLQAEQARASLHAQQVDQSIQLIEALGGGYRAGQDATDSHAGETINTSETNRDGSDHD